MKKIFTYIIHMMIENRMKRYAWKKTPWIEELEEGALLEGASSPNLLLKYWRVRRVDQRRFEQKAYQLAY